ncbi:hypothetical protein QEH52_20085, partial [Coraliomargarita sp. SDUM461003]
MTPSITPQRDSRRAIQTLRIDPLAPSPTNPLKNGKTSLIQSGQLTPHRKEMGNLSLLKHLKVLNKKHGSPNNPLT